MKLILDDPDLSRRYEREIDESTKDWRATTIELCHEAYRTDPRSIKSGYTSIANSEEPHELLLQWATIVDDAGSVWTVAEWSART